VSAEDIRVGIGPSRQNPWRLLTPKAAVPRSRANVSGGWAPGGSDLPYRDRLHPTLKVPLKIYADCGNLKDARASNFQPLSCFCQTCSTPILVLVTLPSSSLSDTHK
jgi:hypothetical protein